MQTLETSLFLSCSSLSLFMLQMPLKRFEYLNYVAKCVIASEQCIQREISPRCKLSQAWIYRVCFLLLWFFSLSTISSHSVDLLVTHASMIWRCQVLAVSQYVYTCIAGRIELFRHLNDLFLSASDIFVTSQTAASLFHFSAISSYCVGISVDFPLFYD